MKDVAVKNMLLQPGAFHELDPAETISYIGGGVPRLIVREGSDAWDLWEGQTLPISSAKAQLINPYEKAAEINIAQGMPVRIGVNSARSGTRHSEQLFYNSRIDVGNGITGRRVGIGFMPKRGRYLVSVSHLLLTADTVANSYRATILNGASLSFLSAKPEGMMMQVPSVLDYQNNPNEQIMAVAGDYTDAEFAAWVAAAGYTGAPASQSVWLFRETTQRWTIDAGTAVFFSREPGAGSSMNNFRFTLEDLGRSASEWF